MGSSQLSARPVHSDQAPLPAGTPARGGRIRDVQTGLSDTDPDVLRLQAELLRQATPARRLEMALSLSAALIDIAYAGIRRRQAGISDVDAGLRFVEIQYGRELAQAVRARMSEPPAV